MYPIPTQARLSLDSVDLENVTGPINPTPVLYPNHFVSGNHMPGTHTTMSPRRASTAMLHEAVYEYNELPGRVLFYNENVFPALMNPQTASASSTPMCTLSAHSSSVPMEISLADAMMKRPRLFRDPCSTKQFITPPTIHRLPFGVKTSATCGKTVAYNLGRISGSNFVNSRQIAPIAAPSEIQTSELMFSSNSLVNMPLPIGLKQLKSPASIDKEDRSKVASVGMSSATPAPQFGLPVTSRSAPLPVSASTCAKEVTTSIGTESVVNTSVTNTTSTVSTESNDPLHMDVSASQTEDGSRATHIATFKHEPRKRKAQPLTISSVNSFGASSTNPNKSDLQNLSRSDRPSLGSGYYKTGTDSVLPQHPTSAGSLTVPRLSNFTQDLSQLKVPLPVSRPQSVLLKMTGATRSFGNGLTSGVSNSYSHNALNSSLTQQDTIAKNLRLTKRRPILPNTIRKIVSPAMSTLHSWLVRQPIARNAPNFFPHAPASLLSIKSRVQSVKRSKSVASGTSANLHGPQTSAPLRHSQLPPKSIPSVFTPIDDLLWDREIFGRSNPQQLVYTLVYLFARLFNLRTERQLRDLRSGFRSQFTFVLLKPGETTKPIELLPPNARDPFIAIDSNLFRGDCKSLLMLPRLRLLYTPQYDTDEHVRSVPSQPHEVSTDTTKWRFLLDHFEANNHQRCLLCYHALYLSKRPRADSGTNLDSYFLNWEQSPTSGDWFCSHPMEARTLSSVVDTVRTALECAELMHRKLTPTVNQIQLCSESPNVFREPLDPSSPLNLVIRDQNSHSNSGSSTPKPHPTCLDYWPELTERARQSPWQCSDCKTCTVCQGKGYENELLICDACDKGFHSECHEPKLREPVDRSLPWVCATCQKEGYSVAIGTLPGEQDHTYHHPLPTAMDSSPVKSEVNDSADLTSSVLDVTSVSEKEQVPESAVPVSPSLTSEQPSSVTSPNGIKSRSPVGRTDTGKSPAKSCGKPAESDPSVDGGLLDPINASSNTDAKGDEMADGSRVVLSPTRQSLTFTPNQRENASQLSECTFNSSPTKPPTPGPITRSPDQPSSQNVQSDAPMDGVVISQDLPHSPCTTHPGPHKSEDPESGLDDCVSRPPSADITPFASRPEDIRAWSVEHVRDWLLEEGFHREAEAFHQQEIDGACLLLMKRMDVLTELGIKLGPAVKIYERIKRFQSRCTSPTILCS